jgi:hypothetical protein
MQIVSLKKYVRDLSTINVMNDGQVYRSYRGDVTHLTDIVRCAVKFEAPADLLRFVEEWLFVDGKPQTRDPPPSMISRWVEELQEFKLVVTNSSLPKSQSPNKQDGLLSENCEKIFEILRIRNRLDLELEEVPGGYRDFSLKLNIGFYRQVLSLMSNVFSYGLSPLL